MYRARGKDRERHTQPTVTESETERYWGREREKRKENVVIECHQLKIVTRSLSVEFYSDITRICTECRDPLQVRGKERKTERERKRERESEWYLASEKESVRASFSQEKRRSRDRDKKEKECQRYLIREGKETERVRHRISYLSVAISRTDTCR